MTQRQLADVVGVTIQTISRLETGEYTQMKTATRDALAAALGASAIYLETGLEPLRELPPLDSYLRATANLTDEQIGYVRRAVQAMEAERELADMQAEYAAMQEDEPLSPDLLKLPAYQDDVDIAQEQRDMDVDQWEPD